MPYGNRKPKKMGSSGGGPHMYEVGSKEKNTPMNFSDKAMMYMKNMPAMYGKPKMIKGGPGNGRSTTDNTAVNKNLGVKIGSRQSTAYESSARPVHRFNSAASQLASLATGGSAALGVVGAGMSAVGKAAKKAARAIEPTRKKPKMYGDPVKKTAVGEAYDNLKKEGNIRTQGRSVKLEDKLRNGVKMNKAGKNLRNQLAKKLGRNPTVAEYNRAVAARKK